MVRLAAFITVIVTVLSIGAVPALGAPVDAGIRDGATQPVFDYAQAIRERATVEAGVDSDGDGRRDRVEVRIIRPRESDQGVKVPVIVQPSPYYAGLNDVPNHDDIDRDQIDREQRRVEPAGNRAETITFAGYLDNYFVPRGYAVVFADGIGSGGSEGCPTSGADNETQGMKAVVEWLAAAPWSTGRVGMIGVSYNGTLANAVAATGVRGLETIVPIASISSWYDYYRANGGVVAPGGFQGEDVDVLAKAVLTRRDPEVCAGVIADLERQQDRETGDYSRLWHERNYVAAAAKVRASVLLVHGLNDWNVKTLQAGQWWDALATHGVPRKIWLHQGAHTDPFNVRRAEWLRTLHRWFDRWLYRIDNGIMREPMADVETAPRQWRTDPTWPAPGGHPTPMFLGPADDERPGTLGRWPAGLGRSQGFVDDPAQTAENLTDAELAVDPHRLVYLTQPLDRAVRVSGTPRITLLASVEGRSPYLTALLVDYGPDVRYAGMVVLPGEDCVAPGMPGDPGCFARRGYATATTPWKIVTRGWLDVRNRHSAAVSEPIAPGRTHAVSWRMQTQDHTFKAGHRIGLVITSTDRAYTLRYPAGTAVRVGTGLSHVLLPLAK